MKQAIGLLKMNYFSARFADATVATCRAAGHKVVSNVFERLDKAQLINLVNYYDGLILQVDREQVNLPILQSASGQ